MRFAQYIGVGQKTSEKTNSVRVEKSDISLNDRHQVTEHTHTLGAHPHKI